MNSVYIFHIDVIQNQSTTVIHPGHVGDVDPYLNILIHPEGTAPGAR